MSDKPLGITKQSALIYNMACTVFLLVSIYIRYDLWLEWSKTVQRYTKYDTLVNTGLWKSLLLEMIICIIAPVPFLDGIKYKEYVAAYETWIEYEVNDILLFWSFTRLYLGIRFSLYLSQFMNPRSQRVCAMHGCDAGIMFAVKSAMK